MKKDIGLFAIAIVLSTAFGCKDQKGRVSYKELEFDNEVTVGMDTLTGEQFWGGTAKIQLINDRLYVVAYEQGNPTTWLHVFDTAGNKIRDLIPLGRGPKEASMITTAQVFDSALILFDPQENKEISIMEYPTSGNYRISEEHKEQKQWMWNCLKANDEEIMFFCPGPLSDETDLPRIVLESSGELIDDYRGSPFDNEASAIKFYLEAMRSCFALSKNGKHYAISYCDAGILQFFFNK